MHAWGQALSILAPHRPGLGRNGCTPGWNALILHTHQGKHQQGTHIENCVIMFEEAWRCTCDVQGGTLLLCTIFCTWDGSRKLWLRSWLGCTRSAHPGVSLAGLKVSTPLLGCNAADAHAGVV